MSKPLDPEHPGKFSSSLVAGLGMLTCFTAEHPVRGIADMAAQLDLGRSTTHRYATTLVTLGYLEQGPSRKYRLSSRVCDVGLSLLDSMVVRRVAREHLRSCGLRPGGPRAWGSLGGSRLPTSTVGRGRARGSTRSMRVSGWVRACPSIAPPRVRRSWRVCPRRSSGS